MPLTSFNLYRRTKQLEQAERELGTIRFIVRESGRADLIEAMSGIEDEVVKFHDHAVTMYYDLSVWQRFRVRVEDLVGR